MNVSELARILKISPQELRDKLPQLGFDIGQKAIKVDNVVANRIIRQWPELLRKLRESQTAETVKEVDAGGPQNKKEIKVPAFVTVRDFAALAGLPVNRVLSELMKNGIFTSLNEKIDFETAAIIGADLKFEVIKDESLTQTEPQSNKKIEAILGQEKSDSLTVRPPVVVVMGHVDHGKTKLLDAIRRTNVVESEAGGITQHIGAYQVVRKDKVITFIDTPGHEAFTAMRSRGARIADIAILVVAADDGVKPQTVEAFRIIEAAKIPYVVAINKIDKPEANIEKTKQELSSQLAIVPEDWGGKTVCAPISAKEGKGIEELLDIILLTAEMEADNIKANPSAFAVGTIIESRLSKGEGPVATVLIQNGTLKIGDQLVFEQKIYGKVRALKNHRGENIEQAPPSTPVRIIGLKISPEVGDILEVGEGERVKIKNIKAGFKQSEVKIESKEDDNGAKKINLLIKSDVLGSAEAIEESLEKIGSAEVAVKIIAKGLGNINEGDVVRAEAAQAKIVGFNVKVAVKAEELAREKNVSIKTYRVIYDLINDVRQEMQTLLEPEIKRIELGKLKIKAIFRSGANEQIAGGAVTEGRAEKDALARVERGGRLLETGKLIGLQSAKVEVGSVEAGQDCGIKYQGKALEVGDVLSLYKEEKVVKKL